MTTSAAGTPSTAPASIPAPAEVPSLSAAPRPASPVQATAPGTDTHVDADGVEVTFATIEEALVAFAAGQPLVVVDDALDVLDLEDRVREDLGGPVVDLLGEP